MLLTRDFQGTSTNLYHTEWWVHDIVHSSKVASPHSARREPWCELPKSRVLVAQSCPTLRPHGLCRREHWSGLPFPSPEHLPDPGIEPRSPALQAASLPPEPWEKPLMQAVCCSEPGLSESGISATTRPHQGKVLTRGDALGEGHGAVCINTACSFTCESKTVLKTVLLIKIEIKTNTF